MNEFETTITKALELVNNPKVDWTIRLTLSKCTPDLLAELFKRGLNEKTTPEEFRELIK